MQGTGPAQRVIFHDTAAETERGAFGGSPFASVDADEQRHAAFEAAGCISIV